MILDTFYLLFKSDTTTAQKDVDDLTKKIDELREKGKARSEQETKDLHDLVKTRNEALKQQKEEVEELQNQEQGYGSLTKAVAGYAAAYFSLNALKGMTVAESLDVAALYRQSELLGQNTEDMKAYALAVERAGGSQAEFTRFVQSMFEEYASKGLPIPQVDELVNIVRYRLELAGDDPVGKQRVFERFNITEGMRPFFDMNESSFNELIADTTRISEHTSKSAESLNEMRQFLIMIAQNTKGLLASGTAKIWEAFNGFKKPEVQKPIKRYEYINLTQDDVNNAKEKQLPAGRQLSSGNVQSITLDIIEYNNKRALEQGSKPPPQIDSIKNPNPVNLYFEDGRVVGSSQPQNIAQEFIEYGKSAIMQAEKMPLNSSSIMNTKNVNVKVGDINVNASGLTPQDVSEEVGRMFKDQINEASSYLDDGVKY